MAERKQYHQLDPVTLTQKDFDGLPFRHRVKLEKYVEGQLYRDVHYPEEVFLWVPYPDGAETKGEWRMGAAQVKGQ